MSVLLLRFCNCVCRVLKLKLIYFNTSKVFYRFNCCYFRSQSNPAPRWFSEFTRRGCARMGRSAKQRDSQRQVGWHKLAVRPVQVGTPVRSTHKSNRGVGFVGGSPISETPGQNALNRPVGVSSVVNRFAFLASPRAACSTLFCRGTPSRRVCLRATSPSETRFPVHPIMACCAYVALFWQMLLYSPCLRSLFFFSGLSCCVVWPRLTGPAAARVQWRPRL